VLNWELLRHPTNWLVIGLMLTILGIAGHLVLTHFGAEPKGPALGSFELPPGETSKLDIAQQVLG